ncbi:zeta toxin family protein [Streptomyces sp. NBC_00723]|uniref:zeta toxin family protein n=1 Tax=Streptomyces sp. NBC_00723 TaxID=2903673 RepID=UPI0038650BD8
MHSEDEREYEEWRAKAHRYSREWWSSNVMANQALDADSSLRAKLEDQSTKGTVETAHVYLVEDAWNPIRHGTHTDVRLSIDKVNPRTIKRQVYIFFGMPGAGKTTCLCRMVHAHRVRLGIESHFAAEISADNVREKLPEYEHGLGSGVVQTEASHITYGVDYPAALESGVDIIIDSIGRPNYVEQWVTDLSQIDCEVHVLGALCTVEVATERMRARALSTGRFLPSEIIPEARDDVEQTARRIQNSNWPVTSWTLVDTSANNVPPVVERGTTPWGIVGELVALW